MVIFKFLMYNFYKLLTQFPQLPIGQNAIFFLKTPFAGYSFSFRTYGHLNIFSVEEPKAIVNKAFTSRLLQVISKSISERQAPEESLIIGKRKPILEFQFQNKFRLGGEMMPRLGSNVILRQGKIIGGDGLLGVNNRYNTGRQDRQAGRVYSSAYCDPCTDYLNNPMFRSLHSRWAANCDRQL